MMLVFYVNKEETLNTSRGETFWGRTDEGTKRPLELPMTRKNLMIQNVSSVYLLPAELQPTALSLGIRLRQTWLIVGLHAIKSQHGNSAGLQQPVELQVGRVPGQV